MPIYEFNCLDCGQTFEHLVMGAGNEGPCCPHCSGTELVRVLSPSAPLVNTRADSACASAPTAECRSCPGGNSCSSFTLG